MSQEQQAQGNPDLEDDAIDAVDDNELGSTPYEHIRERKVVIQPYDYAVRTLMDMIIDGDLVLDPNYQRKYQWDDVKASKFIESIILNIPVPVVYLAEEKNGSFSVIDGQHRLTSLFRFIKANELRTIFDDAAIEPLSISGLKIMSELNGQSHSELDRSYKSIIAKRPIRCIVVLNESDEALKFEVFERLNTGSTSLTDQEVRNCVYRGNYNELIKKLAEYGPFKSLLSLPEHAERAMKGTELVLRFLAYRELTNTTDYSDNYSEYLNLHMEDNRDISAGRVDEISNLFYQTVDLLNDILGPGIAFRKPKDRINPEQAAFAHNVINGAIYESQMVSFSRVIENVNTGNLREKALGVFSNDDYWSSLFQGTSQKNKALRRSTILTQALLG
ncbi:hypothetical protein B194_1682 [Serratia plymuthica A30]|uniref:DUF262 domain-containing protein n=1 Tax=Serratia plymuthica TaxID=82996 RepID=UPI0002A37E2F|nr:DUF262 domain-containing protein [Serratia plymuthica]EKF65170.1 hypothetical protein B194_1682 [Serratia plymuthica A30]